MVPKWPKTAPNGPLWPKMALHGPKWCFNEVPLWPKMTLHDPKCPCMTPNGPKTFLGAYYMTICQLDHHGAFSETLWGHVGLWKGPRVVQHDIISCNIPMRSVLRPFVVMQGYFGSWTTLCISFDNISWYLISYHFQNIVRISLSHFFGQYHTIFNHVVIGLFQTFMDLWKLNDLLNFFWSDI